MAKRIVYKNRINWGLCSYVAFLLIFFITLINIFYLFSLVKIIVVNPDLGAVLIFIISLSITIILNVMIFDFYKSIYNIIFRKYDFILYNTGMEIKGKYFEWRKIKSISFNTGRRFNKKLFYKGFKLPVLQRIFILDKKGKEHSVVIDIDHPLRKDREKNNLRVIRDHLYGMDKISLLSDWAKKRV